MINSQITYNTVMFVCYICEANKALFSAFTAHIRCHDYNSKLTRPIRCCQCSCNSSFVKPFNSLRHVKAFHSEDGQDLGVSVSCDVACHVVPDVRDVINCMLSAEQVWVNLICELLGSVKTRRNLVM